MSPEEARDDATPPRGGVDATWHPRSDAQAMPKLVGLRFSRADHAATVIDLR
jgi:hypothetical protein